ncbi:MAG: glyceraldehyde 3-phosphate dehydrogenase N-terminal domain-containing protein, partial [bacterium]|nr:glyceraldehyde 3-phosphate dehydrogenase N-terminal domain-containing protein [bacterium]
MAIKIGINGFGRIGRLVFKRLITNSEFKKYFDIVGINDLMSTDLLAHLLKYDSVHGVFPLEVSHTKDSIVVGGEETRIFAERDPSKLKWGELGAEIILESTGLFRSAADAGLHLKGGAKKVIISAPAKG